MTLATQFCFAVVMFLGFYSFLYSQPIPESNSNKTYIPSPVVAVSSEEQQQIENLLEQMKRWPLVSAKKAAQSLIEKKQKAVPFLLITLKTGTPVLKEAAAYCLGHLKVENAFQDLAECTKNNELRPRMETFFVALVQINAEKAYPILINFLKSDNQTGHSAALKLLLMLTKERHLPILEELFQSKSDKNRKYAIELLERMPISHSWKMLLAALQDPSPYITSASVGNLGKINSPELRQKLLGYANYHDRRLVSYIALVLLEQEDNFQIQLFNRQWIPELLKAVRHDDYFIKGVAAACLVNVGFISDDEEITKIMDKYLAPVLIETLSGKVYFRDYLAFRNIGYRKLKQLTGKDIGQNMDNWWSWWHENSRQFQAIRLLKGISEDQIKGLFLEYVSVGGLEELSLNFVALPEVAERMAPERPYILDWKQLNQLLRLLRQEHFLNLAAEYGIKNNATFHKITLNLQNYRKVVIVYGNDPGPLSKIIQQIINFRESNLWQKYWDAGKDEEWLKWYRSEEKWWLETQDNTLRSQRIKRMLLSSYGGLNPKNREEASLNFLRLMQKNPDLPNSLATWGVFHIRTETEITSRTENLISALVLSKNETAIMPLVDFLILNYSPKTKNLLIQVLRAADDKLLYQYIRHPNPYTRSAAAEILGTRVPEELTILYLIALLKDEHISVQQAAATSLGNLKAKNATEQLLKILKSSSSPLLLKQSALFALAKIVPQDTITIALEMLNNRDIPTRMSVIQSLVAIGGRTAIQTLAALINGETDKTLQESAAIALSQTQPEQESLTSLLTIVQKSSNVDAKIFALRALQKTDIKISKPIIKKLLPLLPIENLANIQIEIALTLSEIKEKSAIPILIEHLEHPQYSSLIRRTLEQLTLISFSEANPKNRYTDWWRLYQDLSQEQWLLDAMRSREYPMEAFLDYMISGQKNKEMIPIWIQALNDRDWFIRIAANEKLEEFTGVSFGKMHFYTGFQTSRKFMQDWREWYANYEKQEKKVTESRQEKEVQNESNQFVVPIELDENSNSDK